MALVALFLFWFVFLSQLPIIRIYSRSETTLGWTFQIKRGGRKHPPSKLWTEKPLSIRIPLFTKPLNKMDMRIDQISFPAILVGGLCYLHRFKIPYEHFFKTVYTIILEVLDFFIGKLCVYFGSCSEIGLFFWEFVSVLVHYPRNTTSIVFSAGLSYFL